MHMAPQANVELKKLSKELERIDSGQSGGECAMCKFVLTFAVVALLFVVAFTFFFKLGQKITVAPEVIHSERAPAIDPELWNDRVLELGILLHPELATTSPEVPRPPQLEDEEQQLSTPTP